MQELHAQMKAVWQELRDEQARSARLDEDNQSLQLTNAARKKALAAVNEELREAKAHADSVMYNLETMRTEALELRPASDIGQEKREAQGLTEELGRGPNIDFKLEAIVEPTTPPCALLDELEQEAPNSISSGNVVSRTTPDPPARGLYTRA